MSVLTIGALLSRRSIVYVDRGAVFWHRRIVGSVPGNGLKAQNYYRFQSWYYTKAQEPYLTIYSNGTVLRNSVLIGGSESGAVTGYRGLTVYFILGSVLSYRGLIVDLAL